MPRIKRTLLTALGCLAAALCQQSCSTPKDVVYFQDINTRQGMPLELKSIDIKPGDKLSIIVTTRDPLVNNMLNLPVTNRVLGQGADSKYVTSQGVATYTVSDKGDIDFPMLGQVHVGGLTRVGASNLIKGMLMGADLAKEPIVTVEIANAQASVLGEVARPGRYAIDRDNMTLLDLLGEAGDLTIFGVRDKVRLIRTEQGRQTVYTVDLASGSELMSSPAYFVQQDDVVYVEPNATRARQSKLNANTVQSTSFWMSLATLGVTVTALIVK